MAAVANNPGFADKVGVPPSVGASFMAKNKKVKKYQAGNKVEGTRGPNPEEMPSRVMQKEQRAYLDELERRREPFSRTKEGMVPKNRAVSRLVGKRKQKRESIKDRAGATLEEMENIGREYRQSPDPSLLDELRDRGDDIRGMARERTALDKEPLYKRGGKVKKKKKKYAYGGKVKGVRGAGCARKGVRKAQMVKMKGA